MHRNLRHIADLKRGIQFLRILEADLKRRIHHFLNHFFLCIYSIIACLAIHDHLNILSCAEMVLARTQQRVLNRVHHNIFADVLLFLKNCQCFH